VSSAEAAYVVAAWSSWLLPLAAYEIMERAIFSGDVGLTTNYRKQVPDDA
jgi:hypothetical protein